MFARRHDAQRTNGSVQSWNNNTKKKAFTFGEYDDDAGYEGPNILNAFIRVITDVNLKEALVCLEYAEDAGMISITWKLHQEADSGAKLKSSNMPCNKEIGDIALALQAMPSLAQNLMLQARKLDHYEMDEFPKMTITFKQKRKERNRIKDDEILSLNKMEACRISGCLVQQVQQGR